MSVDFCATPNDCHHLSHRETPKGATMYASMNMRRRGTASEMPTNVLLDVIRDTWDSGDPLSSGHEALFQLARHWELWQSERIGTFPLEYRDPSGPVTYKQSGLSGEDTLYWDLDEAIRHYLISRGATIRWSGARDEWSWTPDHYGVGEPAHEVQDMLVQAVTVIERVEHLAESLGHSL